MLILGIVGLAAIAVIVLIADTVRLSALEHRPPPAPPDPDPPNTAASSSRPPTAFLPAGAWHPPTLPPDRYAPWLSRPRTCGDRLSLSERVKDHYWSAETRATLALEAAGWSDWRRAA